MFDAEKLAALKRGELQKLAKENGVKANLRSADIIEELRAKYEAGEFVQDGKPVIKPPAAAASDDKPTASADKGEACPSGEVIERETAAAAAPGKSESALPAPPADTESTSALPRVDVRFCVVDGASVASVQWHQIILRGGRLFVRHAYKVLGDCEFVLKPAKPVESTAEEQDELICDACAALNRQTLAAREDRKEMEEKETAVSPALVHQSMASIKRAASPATPVVAPATPKVTIVETISKAAQRTPLSPWNHRTAPEPAPATASRATAKKLPMMTPADRLKERMNRTRLEQSAKRDKLILARRNIEVETENVDTQATADRYTIPVACMMHQRKLPMTATVDAALINGEDHA